MARPYRLAFLSAMVVPPVGAVLSDADRWLKNSDKGSQRHGCLGAAQVRVRPETLVALACC